MVVNTFPIERLVLLIVVSTGAEIVAVVNIPALADPSRTIAAPAAAVTKSDVSAASRATWPFVMLTLGTLLIVARVPPSARPVLIRLRPPPSAKPMRLESS